MHSLSGQAAQLATCVGLRAVRNTIFFNAKRYVVPDNLHGMGPSCYHADADVIQSLNPLTQCGTGPEQTSLRTCHQKSALASFHTQ